MSVHEESATGFDRYLTVSEAAKVLGVTPATLRNWDKKGKLRPIRHPINGYRLYTREQIQKILQELQRRSDSEKE